MPLTVNDFAFEEGQTNMGGLGSEVLVIPASQIDTFVVTVAVDGTRELTAMTVKVPLTQGCASIYCTPDTGQIMAKSVGEKDGMSFEVEHEFYTPGGSKEALAVKTQLNNGGFVTFQQDQDGWLVCGSPQYPAYSTGGDATSGKAPKDRRGVAHKMSAPSPIGLLRVAAALTIPRKP